MEWDNWKIFLFIYKQSYSIYYTADSYTAEQLPTERAAEGIR